MLTEYIQKALELAVYKILDDGTWFAEIPGFQGVWANGKNVEDCRRELMEVLEEWLILKIRDHDTVPVLEGTELKIEKVEAGQLPSVISRRKLIRKFRSLGYRGPYSGGKHQFMVKGEKKIRIPNPHKSSDVSISLVKEILRQAKISIEEWDNA